MPAFGPRLRTSSSTYYLSPDNKTAGSSFAVIREGLQGSAGVGRLAMHGREYLVAVVPRDSALVAYTLRTAGEVRSLDSIDELKYADVTPKGSFARKSGAGERSEETA